jgi:hypothetical protein
MEGSFKNFAHPGDPPWVDVVCPFEVPTTTSTESVHDFYMKLFWSEMQEVLRTKLRTLQRKTKSPELNRQLLLAVHERLPRIDFHPTSLIPFTCSSGSYRAGTLISHLVEIDFSSAMDGIRPGYRQNIVYPGLKLEFSNFSSAYEFGKALLLHVYSFLLDAIADYWNEVALAQRAWRSFSGAFRQFLESALQFKPLHTPLRLFPNSIHPIGSAA